ncbi:unnamed protein product [Dibothriocephalus latus]|uniref:Reverse transcriptase/retrotransposon-derived protein RNase H-like domain-containing protein n=1 Tax=Dibothriocephalus latus TaxID=60516 RepID=A0A3P6T291_DIBLA|nr:unnamed protein product [Dibothriocephalus latus]
MLQKDAPWYRSSDCEKNFAQLKLMLSSELLFTHYDPTLPVLVAVDTSNHGISAVTLHTSSIGLKREFKGTLEITVSLATLFLFEVSLKGFFGVSLAMVDAADRFDYLFKFLIIGNASSGKTCILRRYTERKFFPNTQHTIGAEFGSKIVNVDGTYVKIQIWDTAGQERFRSMARSYYRDAVGTLLVYDVTNRQSFDAVGQWLSDARQLASPNVVVILVGNKKDLQDTDGQVTHWEANAFAQENDMQLIETSALTGENVDEAFTQCVRTLLAKVKSGEMDPDRIGGCKPHGVTLTAGTPAARNSSNSPRPQFSSLASSGNCSC